jgi:phosphoglycolate phosphatase
VKPPPEGKPRPGASAPPEGEPRPGGSAPPERKPRPGGSAPPERKPRPGGSAPPRLILWDVDGTLVDSAKLGRDAFFDAFERVVGRPPTTAVPFAGRTDLEIAHDMFEQEGVADGEALLDRFEEELVRAMAARLDALKAAGRALPGTREALERLHGEPGVIQSLLTGNVERNAMLKLKPFGLTRWIEFGCGGYGSDHRVRGELVAIARGRAERAHGVTLNPGDVVLIGDTPLDVAAAREGGARAVAVATGPYGEDELASARADVVLPDLADTARVAEAVLGNS